MSRPLNPSHSGSRPSATALPLVNRVLYYVLLAVLCARPLISETFERSEFPFLAPAASQSGPTPATTTWLDAILLCASVVVWARPSATRGRHYNPTKRGKWVALAIALLAAALPVSVAAAADKRVAANAASNLLITAIAATALVRLMRRTWMARLLLAALLAGGCATAVKCCNQRAFWFDDTREYWQEHKQRLAAQGADLSDPTLVNYERRLFANETYGYLFHPNVTAACLTMSVLVMAGVFAGRLRRGANSTPTSTRWAAAAIVLALCAPLLVAMRFTGSTGALVATAGGIVVLVLLGLGRRWIAAHTHACFVLLSAAYLALIAAGAAYGLVKDTWPHASLEFRWQYWKAATQAVSDAPLTGLGRQNFAAAFLKYKNAEATEEVRNPHNLWLSLLTELGPLGLAAGVLLTGICLLSALRSMNGGRERADDPLSLTVGRLMPAILGVLFVQAAFSGTQLSNSGVALWWAVEFALSWVVAFALTARILAAGETTAQSAWLGAGFAAAIMAALVHNLIGFSLLTAAGIAVFAVVAACACAPAYAHTGSASSAAEHDARSSRTNWNVAGVGLLLVLAHLVLVVVPTTRAELLTTRMHRLLAAAPTPDTRLAALREGLRAVSADRWDAATPCSIARTTLRWATADTASTHRRLEWLSLARRYARVAGLRNPQSHSTQLGLAMIAQALADASFELGDGDRARTHLAQAARHGQAAVQLYPTNPRTRISAGTACFRLWQETGSEQHARKAWDHLQAATLIDSRRPPDAAVRLREKELRVIREHVRELRAAGFSPRGG